MDWIPLLLLGLALLLFRHLIRNPAYYWRLKADYLRQAGYPVEKVDPPGHALFMIQFGGWIGVLICLVLTGLHVWKFGWLTS